jgi:hypothetical protein
VREGGGAQIAAKPLYGKVKFALKKVENRLHWRRGRVQFPAESRSHLWRNALRPAAPAALGTLGARVGRTRRAVFGPLLEYERVHTIVNVARKSAHATTHAVANPVAYGVTAMADSPALSLASRYPRTE